METQDAFQQETERDSNESNWYDQEAGTSNEQADLRDYNLTRDRKRRSVKTPSRYGYADIMAYAFSVAEEMDTDEPKTYRDAVTSKDKEHGYQQ